LDEENLSAQKSASTSSEEFGNFNGENDGDDDEDEPSGRASADAPLPPSQSESQFTAPPHVLAYIGEQLRREGNSSSSLSSLREEDVVFKKIIKVNDRYEPSNDVIAPALKAKVLDALKKCRKAKASVESGAKYAQQVFGDLILGLKKKFLLSFPSIAEWRVQAHATIWNTYVRETDALNAPAGQFEKITTVEGWRDVLELFTPEQFGARFCTNDSRYLEPCVTTHVQSGLMQLWTALKETFTFRFFDLWPHADDEGKLEAQDCVLPTGHEEVAKTTVAHVLRMDPEYLTILNIVLGASKIMTHIIHFCVDEDDFDIYKLVCNSTTGVPLHESHEFEGVYIVERRSEDGTFLSFYAGVAQPSAITGKTHPRLANPLYKRALDIFNVVLSLQQLQPWSITFNPFASAFSCTQPWPNKMQTPSSESFEPWIVRTESRKGAPTEAENPGSATTEMTNLNKAKKKMKRLKSSNFVLRR